MPLLKVTIEGFRAFSTKQVVYLPQGPGLYLMRGINEVDASLAGNDVGKSTFFDAVVWGLFGQTTRGLRAGQVVSWGKKSAVVEQVWELNGKQFTIKRRQSPNGLWINDQPVEQDAVITALGLTAEEFLHSVLFGQFSDYFLDLSPADKLLFFGDVLGLSYWESRADIASKKVGDLELTIRSISSNLQRLSGKLDGLSSVIDSLKSDSAAWQNSFNAKRDSDSKLREDLENALIDLNAELVTVGQRLSRLDVKLAKRERVMRDFKEEQERLSRLLTRLDQECDNTVCPYCGQDMPKDKLEHSQEEYSRINEEHKNVNHSLQLAVAATDEVRWAHQDVTAEQCDIQSRIRDLKCKLNSIPSLDATNPYEKSLLDAENDFAATTRERDRIDSEHSKLLTDQNRWKFWVKGFRDLRLWVLDATLAELELQVNNSLVQLGLPDWSIHMSVERENKSGGVTRGFTVDVVSPGSTDSVPWKGWGGGVTQRLKVATEIGLSKLIADRRCVDLGVEVWDEPDSHLSRSGVDDLLTHLRDRSINENRQIWVVTHSALDFPFDGVATVTKTDNGSEVSFS